MRKAKLRHVSFITSKLVIMGLIIGVLIPNICSAYKAVPLEELSLHDTAKQDKPSSKTKSLDQRTYPAKKLFARYTKEDCDFKDRGAEGCYNKNEPKSLSILKAYEERRRSVFMAFAVAMLVLIILLQWIIKISTEGVSKSRDRYLKNYEEAVFRQISCVLLVVALIEIAIQGHVLGDWLEYAFFHDVTKEFHYALDNITNFSHFDLILESLLLVSLIFASYFLIFAIYLGCCVFGINRWFRKADRIDIQNATLRITGSKQAAVYLSLRYEFEAAVQQSCVPGLDPPGLYFQNYCRACTFHIASRLLLIPPSTLLIAFVLTICAYFMRVSSFAHYEEIVAVVIMATIPLLVLLILALSVWRIKRQLLPTDLYKYLQHRLVVECSDASDSINGATTPYLPPYRTCKRSQSTCLPECIANLCYGTSCPNNHEALFLFWRRGPKMLTQITEMAYFTQLVTASLASVLCATHGRVWLDLYWPWAPLAVFAICALQWLMLPTIVWNLVIANCTSGLVDDSILQEVWETQRGRAVHRFRTLVDTIRCEANLYKIEKGGRKLRESWNDRCLLKNSAFIRQDDATFRSLDPHNTGGVTRCHLYRYLQTEGVPLTKEKHAQRWVTVFDRKNRGHLEREDFGVLAWNVRTLMSSPLDIDAVTALFCERYGLSLDGVMDVPILAAIFEKWHVNWNEAHVLHLFQYMTSKRGIRSINVRLFLRSLMIVETKTIGTLRQAMGEMTSYSSLDGYI